MTAELEPRRRSGYCREHGLHVGPACPGCRPSARGSVELVAAPAAPATGAATGTPADELRAGRYDDALRRRPQRNGREKGCWVYIPRDELVKAGVDPDGELPFYRVWGRERGSVLVRLYREV